ncbi:MAG: polysaccharide biosynthesis tyrosine autokinase [Sedimentisphaerales bacterium]|nr:polysaccharide biosynthesis tyrosine autokinase [Sedimentisphaerales bacterium]
MDDLVEHRPQPLQNHYVPYEEFPGQSDPSSPDLIQGILRRWYIVLITFVVMCGGVIPVVWYAIKPQYTATAIIQIASAVSPVLFSDAETGELAVRNNLADQAVLLTRDQVLEKVVDSLAVEELNFFNKKDIISQKPLRPIEILRRAIDSNVIRIAPQSRSELIEVSVQSESGKEAELIANAFLSAFMAIEGNKITQGRDRKLQLLEDERRQYADKMARQRDKIRQMAEEFGSTELTPREEMMLRSVAFLQDQLTQLEASKLTLEARIAFLEKTMDRPVVPGDLLERHQMLIQNDPLIQSLTQRIAQIQEDLISAKQTLAEGNPELKVKAELLEQFRTELEKRREYLEKTFKEDVAQQASENKTIELATAKAELESLITREDIIREKLDEENSKTIGIGRKHLDIGEEQEQLAIIKETYDNIRRRIQMLEMEQNRDPRITTYPASVAPAPSKRKKLIAAATFGSLAFGMLLAFLRDKADKSMYTPDDVIRSIGVPVIGTSTRLEHIDKADVLEHIAHDYQTIRANLRLLNDGKMPRILVVTSPRMAEGKTTLAINLASSLAQAGNKVLLIDGDLRKPDIARLLNLPVNSLGLSEVLSGSKRIEDVIHSLGLTGLDVLTSDGRKNTAAIEHLSNPESLNIITEMSRNYDNVIIDTPPVLAVPDALLWAKMADAVILSSLAGQSIGSDLKETLDRLGQLNIRILGNVLSNVSARHSYNRYGYDYYETAGKSRRNGKRRTYKALLPSLQSKNENTEEITS